MKEPIDSIITAQSLPEKTKFASRNWFYEFRKMPSWFDEKACESTTSNLLERYSKITKSWNIDRNSEWFCRLFLGAKMIMAATLQINSMLYAEERNLRIVVPYLRYYSLFSLLCAVVYTLPEHKWRDGRLFQILHSEAIGEAVKYLHQFDEARANSIDANVRTFKAERELISYRAPSSGDGQISQNGGFLDLCALLADVAQFNSELFEASVTEYGDKAAFAIIPEYLKKISDVEIEKNYFWDTEDGYRLDSLAKKDPQPRNIWHLMTEGHIDNFFGAWRPLYETEGVFNPDEKLGIIFDIP